ncbi:MAG: AAA family ATPase [Candidatus Margulisiibacteriota bacterium]
MKRILSVGLVLLCCFSAPAFCEKPLTPGQLYDKATIQYLVGDLSAAGKNVRILLKMAPNYPGARQLLNSILREKGLKQIPVKPPVPPPTLEVLKPTAEAAPLALGAKIKPETLTILFGIGGATLSLIIILLAWMWIRAYRRRRVRRCFSCGAEISTNIDQCQNCGAWIGAKMQRSITKAQRNWYKKLNWRKNPFTLDIHPELFTGFKEEVKQILEKVASESGHILITAPLGSGKTTLLRWLSNQLVVDSFAVYIPRPPMEFSQLIKLIVEKMGVAQKEAAGYDIYHLQELRKRVGKTLIILIDEAHEFTVEIEKPLRTLGDIDGVKLIMAGLPETVEKFKREIRPLYERLVLNINLKPIDFVTVKDLIRARIEYFGGEGTTPFSTDALEIINEISGGVPRKVIKACDWAVTRAIETGAAMIDGKLLEELKKIMVNLDHQ